MANEIEAEVREYVKNEIEHGHVPTFKEVYSKYGNKEDVYENMDLRTAWLSALAEHASDEVEIAKKILQEGA